MASAMTEGIRASGHCRSYAHPSAVRPRQFTTPPALRATSPYTGEALARAFAAGAVGAQARGRAMRAPTVRAFGRGLRRIGRAARAGG